MEKEKHIGILAVLHIAWGGVALIIGVFAFVFFVGIGIIANDAQAMGILGFIGILAAIFMSVIALPGILAGVGLLQRREWGRILALVVGILNLIDIPIGTALGVYTIWVLMDDNIKKAFTSGTRAKPPATQQAPTT
jgi:hypothetical protein